MPASEVFHKFKTGALRSGGSGERVTSRKQAIAIYLSEKRNEAGGHYKEGKKHGSKSVRK